MSYLGDTFRKLFFKNKFFNRRVYSRTRLTIPLPCELVYNPGPAPISCSAFFTDISEISALLMVKREKVLPGNMVDIRLKIPPREGEIFLQGKVTRTYRKHSREWYFSGVEFNNKEDPGLKALYKYIIDDYERVRIGIKERW